jgi:hypothetical protein
MVFLHPQMIAKSDDSESRWFRVLIVEQQIVLKTTAQGSIIIHISKELLLNKFSKIPRYAPRVSTRQI